tara:strand:- start:292 stop:810 length:519 start_codon:yes stop_codon:yes gene_type:complete
MSKSTPINQISSLPTSGGDESMQMPIVQDILNEISQSESMSTPPPMTQDGRSEFNAPSVNYQMDPNIQPLPNQGFQNTMAMPNLLQYQQQLLTPPKNTESFLNTFMSEVKLPLLTALIYLIMASPKVMRIITSNIAFTVTGDVINTSGYILLAVLTGILFFIGKFMMNKLEN